MSKYRLLMHPSDSSDTYLLDEEFDSVDAAVRHGMGFGTSDFLVIQVVEWQVVTKAEAV